MVVEVVVVVVVVVVAVAVVAVVVVVVVVVVFGSRMASLASRPHRRSTNGLRMRAT